MGLVQITPKNSHIFEVFEQDYEAEFSAITKKEPDAEGRFSVEADWREPNNGFYFYIDEKPAGFVIRAIIDGRSDIAEFYILPCYRKKGFGKAMAFAIFDLFSGPWQVRQICTATAALTFWRTIIDEYTHGNYTEDQTNDPFWGTVIRQLFYVKMRLD
jgi:predicted acetyltransferase